MLCPTSFCLNVVLFLFMVAYDVWAGCAGGNVSLFARAVEASWYTACVSV